MDCCVWPGAAALPSVDAVADAVGGAGRPVKSSPTNSRV